MLRHKCELAHKLFKGNPKISRVRCVSKVHRGRYSSVILAKPEIFGRTELYKIFQERLTQKVYGVVNNI